jgi:hypothetical protein
MPCGSKVPLSWGEVNYDRVAVFHLDAYHLLDLACFKTTGRRMCAAGGKVE